MSISALPERKQITARLADARQTAALLLSQIEAGTLEIDFLQKRLEDLSELLEDIVAEREASDQQSRLATLYEVSKALGSSLDLDAVLHQSMDSIVRLTGAERGFLMLFGDDGQLEVKVARNMERQELEEEDFAISRSVINLVLQNGEPVVTTNASDDPRFATQMSVIAYKLRSIQCVPLRTRGKVIGAIYVDNRVRSGVFDAADLETLTAFANQAAMAIENARLFTLTDETLSRRVEELSMLQEIDRQLNATLDFRRTMGLTLEWAVRVTGADNGAIAIIDIEEGKTEVIAQHGKAPAGVTAMLAGGDVRSKDGSLTVPIQREGRVVGVVALDRQDNHPFSFEAQQFVLRMADHAAISIENARLYEAVKRANETKSEFVSVMTHELRIPMTSIKGYAEMLAMVGELSPQQKSFLQIILNNVARMSHQVSDLSDISRIESGRLKVEIEEEVDFRESLEQVIRSVQAEIVQREHTLLLDIPEDLPAVRADPQRLAQIFTNLISNAYKYTPNGGVITIRAAHEGRFVWCEVQDTGVGILPEEMAKLFTKFWRADNQYVREQHGTGLGLAIAKSLVEMQGGTLTATSEKDVGTTFQFTVPVSK